MRIQSHQGPASQNIGLKRAIWGAAISAACIGVISPIVRADVVHRYSFNTNGAAEDTGTGAVGGLTDGTIIQGAGTATVSGGVLTTGGLGSGVANTNPQVNLPLFAISDLTGSFAVESYFTRGAAGTNNYSTLYSFSAGNTNNYFLATPGRGDGTNQASLAIKQAGVNGGAEFLLRGPVLAAGSSHAMVGAFNAPSGTATLYLDGVATSQSGIGQLTGFNFSNNAVKAGINGNGPFADVALIGSTDEFRINDVALTATQAALNFLAGPNNATAIVTNNSTASGDYNTAANYDNGAPTATQVVVLNNASTLSTGTGAAFLLRVGSTGVLNLNGGTLAPTTNLDLTVGGVVNLNAGATFAARGITADGDNIAANTTPHVFNLNGGTLQAATMFYSGATNIAYTVNSATTLDSNGTLITLGGSVTGTAALNKVGAGTALLAGDLSGYTGGRINVNGGVAGFASNVVRTGANAYNTPIYLDPNNTGVSTIGFSVGQNFATDVTSVITLGQPTVATTYSLTGGAGTNQNYNQLGDITGGNGSVTLSMTGFFKITGAKTYVGKTQINANTAIALSSPLGFGPITNTLVSNGGGIEPQTGTALLGANKFMNPISVLANQAIFFTGNNPIDVGSSITGTLGSGTSTSDIQKSGTGVVSLQGTATNIRNVVLNGAGGTQAVPRVLQFASNFAATNASTATVRGGIFDDNQGGNNDVQYAELTGGVTVSNLVLASKGRSLVASPPVSGLVLNSAAGNNTWAGGLQIVNGGGGHHVNVATGSTLNIGGVINNNVGGTNRGYELTGAGTGVINATAIDGTYYVAAPAASQLTLIMIGETNAAGTALTNNGNWSLNATGNTLSGGIQVVGGRLNINGTTTSASTAASNQVFGYGGTLGGTGSISQPVYIYASGVSITNGAFTAGFSTTNAVTNFLSYIPQTTGFTTAGGAIDPGTAANTIGTLTLASTLNVNGSVVEQIDGTGAGSADKLAVAGTLTLGASSALTLSNITAPDDAAYILASYGTLSGTFGTVTGVPSGYTLNYAYNGNQIALVGPAALTLLYFTGSQSNVLSTNNGGSTNFSTDSAGLVNSTSLPTGASDLVFAASGNTNAANFNVTLGGNRAVNSLTFGVGANTTTPVTIGGTDTLTINAAAGASPAGTGITVQAGSAANTISSKVALGASQSWTNNGTNTFTVSGAVNLAANTLTVAGTGPTALSGAISGTGGLTKTGAGTATLSGTNSYSGATSVTAGLLSVTTSSSLPAASAVSVGGGTGTGTLKIGGFIQNVPSVAFGAGGKFDVGTGEVLINNGGGAANLAAVRAKVVSGYAGGALNGDGFISSLANTTTFGVGYADTGTAIEVRYTLYGDATLDGTVDTVDFAKLIGGFGNASQNLWGSGDFNYDSTVNSVDFGLLVANYGATTPALLPAALPANLPGALVPEPTTIGLAAFALAGLARRRRS